MLTREAWVESSESAPGVNLRCRKPLGGTFVSCEGKAAFDNRLCIVGKKKKVADKPAKCFVVSMSIKYLVSCKSRKTQLSSSG